MKTPDREMLDRRMANDHHRDLAYGLPREHRWGFEGPVRYTTPPGQYIRLGGVVPFQDRSSLNETGDVTT